MKIHPETLEIPADAPRQDAIRRAHRLGLRAIKHAPGGAKPAPGHNSGGPLALPETQAELARRRQAALEEKLN